MEQGFRGSLTLQGEEAGQGEAAGVVMGAALAQLLQPCQHQRAAAPVHKRIGRVQYVPQVQPVRPWQQTAQHLCHPCTFLGFLLEVLYKQYPRCKAV